MSEFKGTKGKWKIENIKSPFETAINSSEYRIAAVKHYEGKNFNDPIEKEAKANALLISKAPEMLEMLQEFVLDFDNGLIDDFQITRDRFEKLIKEATEF